MAVFKCKMCGGYLTAHLYCTVIITARITPDGNFIYKKNVFDKSTSRLPILGAKKCSSCMQTAHNASSFLYNKKTSSDGCLH